MNKDQFEIINDEWTAMMKADDYQRFFVYEPFSDSYWNEKNRIVFCNLESYDANCGEATVLTLDKFESYLRYPQSHTPNNTAIIVSAIQDYIATGSFTDASILRNRYHDIQGLRKAMETVTYMNLRKEMADSPDEDGEAINYFLHPNFDGKKNIHNRECFIECVQALDPHIFIVSGDRGADIVARLFGLKGQLFYQGCAWFGETLVVSIKHPRSIYYEEMAEIPRRIIEAYEKADKRLR